jgi:RNA polymerase sigma-70 factor (ECF subfamily)
MSAIDDTPTSESRALTDQFWRDLHEPLRRFCAVVVGPSDADDLAAETFLRCRDRIVSGRVRNPQSYLFRSAVHAAQNRRRSRAREYRRTILVAAPLLDGERPDLGHVRDAVRALSPRQRAVLYLAYWEDQTESQIAETLGLHIGTVRRHRHRAHQQLRKALR